MRILKFEGATMRDAIAKVKAELGDQAVIISTRQVRRGLLGAAIEISAAIEDTGEADMRTPAFAAPAPAPVPTAQQRGHEIEAVIAPLRTEMKSLRALVRATDSGRGTNELRSEISELRKLVERLATTQVAAPPAPTPPAIVTISNSGPAQLPTAVIPSATPTPRHSKAVVARPMPNLTKPSTGRVLVLVGPTGAGKTTTVAKLAARAALIDNKRVRLITLDNYRVGGVDQIRTFADLIGVPLAVAESVADLAVILADDPDYDLTLVDTAGKSPRDTSSIIELASELANLPPLEVHVVVPAAATAAAIDELVSRFRPLGPSRLLFTKIDEVESANELATAPHRTGLPITWVTTGQAVPEDIEEPTTGRVLELAANGLGQTSSNHRAA